MDKDLLQALKTCGTDLGGVSRRFAGNETLYVACLDAFLKDQTLEELKEAITNEAWGEAFTAAHALKGLAGNMGFVPLFHSTGELVMLIRVGRISEIGEEFHKVDRYYKEIVNAISVCDALTTTKVGKE